jgi:hypothetical protein
LNATSADDQEQDDATCSAYAVESSVSCDEDEDCDFDELGDQDLFATFNAISEVLDQPDNSETVMRRPVARLLLTPCTINGHMMSGLVDSGANVSNLSGKDIASLIA